MDFAKETEVIIYEVPHIFIAGTKAKANEVNENFDYILKLMKNHQIQINNMLSKIF